MMLFQRHVTSWLSAYCEGVLPPAENSRVAGHLLGCRPCRRQLELVREGLRCWQMMTPAPSEDALPVWGDLAPLLESPPPRVALSFRWLPAMAAMATMAVLAVGGALYRSRPWNTSSPLEDAALAAHRAPVALATGDDALLRRWLTDEMGLRATWPSFVPGRLLLGGTPLSGGGAALTFSWKGEPVTLAVSRADRAAVGPKEIDHRTVGDLQVASWMSGDQSYVLVSRLRGEASCAVCHGLGARI